MSVLTEWFEGRQVDEDQKYERAYWGRIATELACAVCLGLILAGCATEVPKSSGPQARVCMVRPLGQTDTGMPVVGLICVTPEEFAESQK